MTDAEVRRMALVASCIPRASAPDACLVDIGGTVFWLPIYGNLLNYKKVIVLARPGETLIERFSPGEISTGCDFEIRQCDAELDSYPVEEGTASCVTCFDVLEHLAGDPMHLIAESNRILRHAGALCLSTPNVLWADNLLRFTFGYHPYSWSVYTHSYADRHNREYTPWEIKSLFENGGFTVENLRTSSYVKPGGEGLVGLIRRILARALTIPAAVARQVDLNMRESETIVRGTKTGSVLDRYPGYLYDLYGCEKVIHPRDRTSDVSRSSLSA